MAHFRQRPNGVEVTIKRTGVLPKPLVFTVPTMEEAKERAERLEAQLDNGILPPAVMKQRPAKNINELVDLYLLDAHPSIKDQNCLGVLKKMHGKTALDAINAAWVDDWVATMKRKEKLKPSSIRARVGALARCTDWGMRKKLLMLPDHPLRTLPDGYSQYSASDAHFAGTTIVDESRERRLEPGEFERIVAALEGGVLQRAQRDLVLPYPKALRCLFILALETSMRMREMFTLTLDQVNLAQRTIFLEKTKNGDKRQVPLSSVAIELLTTYLSERIEELKRDNESREPDDPARHLVFPWWDGTHSLHRLGATSDYLSRTFRSVFDAANAPGLNFHDLRHEAISRLFERTTLSETAIMKISGHKSHKMIMRYANLRGSNLADALW